MYTGVVFIASCTGWAFGFLPKVQRAIAAHFGGKHAHQKLVKVLFHNLKLSILISNAHTLGRIICIIPLLSQALQMLPHSLLALTISETCESIVIHPRTTGE